MSTQKIIVLISLLVAMLAIFSLYNPATMRSQDGFVAGLVSEVYSSKVVLKNGSEVYEARITPSTEVVRMVNILGKMVEEKIKTSDVSIDAYAVLFYRGQPNGTRDATKLELR